MLHQSDLSDTDADRLYEAGCDDATIVSRDGVHHVIFDREADSLETAIVTASRDVRSAGYAIDHLKLPAPDAVPQAG